MHKSKLKRARHLWYLQFEGSEFGPLTLEEVRVIQKSGRLKGKLYAWHEGMEHWIPVDQLPQLPDGVDPTPENERRTGNRIPFLATVSFAGAVGICRDLSPTGVQIFSNRFPGSKGTPIDLALTPIAPLPELKTSAEVIRILSDGRGFAARFTALEAPQRELLRKYMFNAGSQ